MNPISTRGMIKEVLTQSNKSLSIPDIIAGTKSMFGINKTKHQIRTALNSYDCKDIVRVGEGMYDLLSRVINGIYFRYTLTETDIEKGILSCDREMQFIFDSVFRDKEQPIILSSDNGDIYSKITFYGADTSPRRAIEGLGDWFERWVLCPGDDVIINVVDYDAATYGIAPEKKESRNEASIRKKNGEVADVLFRIASRIREKGGWYDMLTKRVISEYSYKDICPPDTIAKIAESDDRFYVDTGGLGGIFLQSGRPRLRAGRSVAASRLTAAKEVTDVFQFMISLDGINPLIWRRIQVPSYYSFWDLHVAIQDAMGWFDCHLHEFRIKDPRSGDEAYIGIPDEDSDYMTGRKTLEGWHEPVVEWFSPENNTAKYVYDFGDDWEHTVRLEKIMPCEDNTRYPRCAGGERACPPEDVGSVSGYYEFVAIMKDPSHPMHNEMVEWAEGDNFDPERFDFKKVRFDDPAERFREAFRAR